MRHTWTWHFDLPPETLWPVLADTNRFNEAMGLPTYILDEIPQANGTVRRFGRGRAAGFTLEWEEAPYEWVVGRHFRQTRLFSKGPFRRFGPVFDLEPEGTGSKVTYGLEWEPLTLAGRLFGARLAARAGEAVARRILEAVSFLKGEQEMVFDLPPPKLPEGARARATTLADAVDRIPYGNGLGHRLSDYVLGTMASDLSPLRPKRLAEAFAVPRREAIEACLAAAKVGLLTMSWNLLCTNCRGPASGATSLSELPRGAHCPSCNIDYERDFERNVELAFSPSPAIRPLDRGAYCLSGPTMTPHVAVQLLLAPAERRTVQIELPPGPWRLRTLHPGIHTDIDYRGGAFPGLRADENGVTAMDADEPGAIIFANDAPFELAILIEDRRWSQDALTAPEVITLQAFRDLFADATLRPGDEAAIGQIALLFSDLRGSTALYERVGDSVAFNIVRDHFAFLAAIVRDHGGAIVKTIGDAIMASFGEPADAVKAALAMQVRIADFNRERGATVGGIALKLGVHAGPSVIVSLNERLDYFGSTVNMAARLQGQSVGGDIVVSGSIARDPAVQPLLANFATQEESVALKGFADAVGFVRVLRVD